MALNDFDASRVQPVQPGSMGGHPPGIHDFNLTNSWLKVSKEGNSLMLEVELTSPVGRMVDRFIVDSQNSPQAVEIGQKNLSALCHAIGIFRVAYPKNPDGSPIMERGGESLRGGRGKMEVAPQIDGKTKQETGYMEVKKYFDVHGNEPGKSGSAPQPQQANNSNWSGNTQQAQNSQPQPQPMTQQPGGSWGNNNQPQQQPQQNNAGGGNWGGNQPPQQSPSNQQSGGWQPQQNNGQPQQTPPWGQK